MFIVLDCWRISGPATPLVLDFQLSSVGVSMSFAIYIHPPAEM